MARLWEKLLRGLRPTPIPDFPDAPARPARRGMAEHATFDAATPQTDVPFATTGPGGHRGRMRERLLERGADGLADYELLEMLLFLAFKKGDTKPLAKKLINQFGSYAAVLTAPADALFAQEGIGVHSVAAIKLIHASALRLAQTELAAMPVLNNWDRLIDYLTIAMARETIEQFRVLYLDNRNRLIANEIASRGTINHTQVYVRELVKRTLETHATALILVHNHPSGDPSPSREDIEMTREVQRAIALLDVTLHDHIIIGKGAWLSFRREGLLKAA
ncbi:RadC family protein [Acidiphilium acidophilum]|uniref:DNA repair protein RadC n=1 Tax=Acidiphilium acidophilum TaxID=76588 RepID=A0AAW9DUD9_ACIAO|nr:DNA repair protein RadC [Acidiphilium acidophilum]MDX5932251.1 DNA repair protein RadC [Acidiphilium acidophilum]